MNKIIVLDSGGQYAHLIANRIRRLNVYSEIKSNDTPAAELKDAQGIILSGGPQSVYEPASPQVDLEIFKLGIPILGICYGHQLIGYSLNGKVKQASSKEYGLTQIHRVNNQKIDLFDGLNEIETVWMSHGDEIDILPEGFQTIYSTKDCKNAVIAHPEKKIYGVQFHCEVTHTPKGMIILDNFLNICEVKKDWTIEHFLAEERERIIKQVGDKNVFLLTSGGVDSTVSFLILSTTLGKEKVYGLFVDTGLMRKNELKEVERNMKELGFTNFHTAHKAKEYFEALKEKYDPEEKRKIIGDLFIDIQQEYARKLNLNPTEWLLGQGTIYPDTIESGGTRHASKIKTHHNRVPQIEALIKKGLVVEPIKELYKDEVRELGIKLGLHDDLVWRHPFPGPGLGVRILCAKESNPVGNADQIESQIYSTFGYQNKILPIKSVGVQGDARTYRHPLVLFPKFQTLNWDELEQVATAITNQFPDINRVILSLSHQTPPEKIEVIPNSLTPNRVEILQEIDAIVMAIIHHSGLMRDIWQFPVVLLPISIGSNKESIVLRPVCSEEAMTANFTKIDWTVLQEITQKTMGTKHLSMLFFDLTNKPPGTIEWE